MFRARTLALTIVASVGLAVVPAAAIAAAPATTTGQIQTAPPPTILIAGTHRPMIPVYAGRDPDLIADSDTLITQVIPLDYVPASDMLALLAELVKPDTPMAASNNYLVVTEASSVVKRIVQIIAYVDVRPPNNNIIVVIPLASGSAPEAARQINAIFNSQGR